MLENSDGAKLKPTELHILQPFWPVNQNVPLGGHVKQIGKY